MAKKKRRSTHGSADLTDAPEELLNKLVQRAKERRLSQVSEEERGRRLSSLVPRERRASVEHETRLARERERKSVEQALEQRRVSKATEPLDNKRKLKKRKRKKRRKNSIGSGKKEGSYRENNRRSFDRDERRISSDDDKKRRHSTDDDKGRRNSSTDDKEKGNARRRSDDDRPLRMRMGEKDVLKGAMLSGIKAKGSDDEILSGSDSGSGSYASGSSEEEVKIAEEKVVGTKPAVDIPKIQAPEPELEKPKPVAVKPAFKNASEDPNQQQRNQQAAASRTPYVRGAITALSLAQRHRLRKNDFEDAQERPRRLSFYRDPTKQQKQLEEYDVEHELAKAKYRREALEVKEQRERLQKEKRLRGIQTKASIMAGVVPQLISPGLKILNAIENFFLQHKVYRKQGCGADVLNLYQFVNLDGQNLLRVVEKTKKKGCPVFGGQVTKMICYDEENSQVGIIEKTVLGGFSSIKQRLKVYCPAEHYTGCIEQRRSWFQPHIDIKDHEGFLYSEIKVEPVPCSSCARGTWKCRHHKIFTIQTIHGAPRGFIREDWDLQQCTHIGVHLRAELNIVVKSLIMIASIVVYDEFCQQDAMPLINDPHKFIDDNSDREDDDEEPEAKELSRKFSGN